MNNIRQIIRRKPLSFLLISLLYLFGIGFLKWGTTPQVGTITFMVGGLLGVYFLDFAEVFTGITPSPFRSIIFVVGLIIVSLFIVTSSGSQLAAGLVLSLHLSIVLWQIGELKLHKHLNDWYRMIAGTVDVKTQQWIFLGCIVMFFIVTALYIRQ